MKHTVNKFVIVHARTDNYYTGTYGEARWSTYIERAKLFDSGSDAASAADDVLHNTLCHITQISVTYEWRTNKESSR